MRIAITGATGNIGTALVRRLTREGGHHLVGLARRLPQPRPAVPDMEWRAVDLTTDDCRRDLLEAFRGADAVVHLAWGFQPSHDTAYLENLGVGGTQRVLDAVGAGGVPHVVHMSSVGAYSPKRDDLPVDETWPTDGIPTSQYSRHKVAAERLLDAFELHHPGVTVTRPRPGIVGQRTAGSALLRYGLPAVVPGRAVSWLPVLPLDRRLSMPMVHSDDVAAAVAGMLEGRTSGPFNLAAEPPITSEVIADALGARLVHVPAPVLRTAMSAAWHARLQPVDTGWLDMGFAVPLLDTARAHRELGWTPTVSADAVLREVLEGMREHASGWTPALRPRTVLSSLGRAARRGPVGQRSTP